MPRPSMAYAPPTRIVAGLMARSAQTYESQLATTSERRRSCGTSNDAVTVKVRYVFV